MNREDASNHDGLMAAIELRWLLRDIRAKRCTLVSLDPVQLQRVIEMGLAEIVEDEPALTEAGREVIERT